MVITGWRLRKIARQIGEDLIVSEDAIDLRIGHSYRLIRLSRRRVHLREETIVEPPCSDVDVDEIPYRSSLCIEPGDLLIIPTLERLTLPKNVMGMINLRSYAARAGLQQATALKISPGFRGYPVLELTSVRPLCLAYEEPIAQLILFETSDPIEYEGRFQDQDRSILYRG